MRLPDVDDRHDPRPSCFSASARSSPASFLDAPDFALSYCDSRSEEYLQGNCLRARQTDRSKTGTIVACRIRSRHRQIVGSKEARKDSFALRGVSARRDSRMSSARALAAKAAVAALRAKSKDSPSVIAQAASAAGKVTGIVGKGGGLDEDKDTELVDRKAAEESAAKARAALDEMKRCQQAVGDLEQRARSLLEATMNPPAKGVLEAPSLTGPLSEGSETIKQVKRDCESLKSRISAGEEPGKTAEGWRVDALASIGQALRQADFALAALFHRSGRFHDSLEIATSLLLSLTKGSSTTKRNALLLPVWLLRGRTFLSMTSPCIGSAGLLLFQLHVDKCFSLLGMKPDHEADTAAANDVEGSSKSSGDGDSKAQRQRVVLSLSEEYSGIGAESELNRGSSGAVASGPARSLGDLLEELRGIVADLSVFQGGVSEDYRTFSVIDSVQKADHTGHCCGNDHEDADHDDHEDCHHHSHHDHTHHEEKKGAACCHHEHNHGVSSTSSAAGSKAAMKARLRDLKRQVMAGLRCWGQIQALLEDEDSFLLQQELARSSNKTTSLSLEKEAYYFHAEGFQRTSFAKYVAAALLMASSTEESRDGITLQQAPQALADATVPSANTSRQLASALINAAYCASRVPNTRAVTLELQDEQSIAVNIPQACAIVALKQLQNGAAVIHSASGSHSSDGSFTTATSSATLRACYWLAVAPSSAAEPYSLPLVEKEAAFRELVRHAAEVFGGAVASASGAAAETVTAAELRGQKAQALANLKKLARKCTKPKGDGDDKGEKEDTKNLWSFFAPLWQ
jgi:hypothetical protein